MQPTPENYAQYIEDRRARTQVYIDKGIDISGKRVKDENLAIVQLEKAGYIFDAINDRLLAPKP